MIRSVIRTTLCSLLRSDLVAELNQTVIGRAEDGFSDGRVELFQQLQWQLELPQLVKEVQTSAGPFSQWTQCDCPEKLVVPCQESE